MLKSKTINNLFWIKVMFYDKFFIFIIIHTHTHIFINIENSGKPETVY